MVVSMVEIEIHVNVARSEQQKMRLNIQCANKIAILTKIETK